MNLSRLASKNCLYYYLNDISKIEDFDFGQTLLDERSSENGVKCEYFTVIFNDSLLAYENKYYLQVYLDNCIYKIVNTNGRLSWSKPFWVWLVFWFW